MGDAKAGTRDARRITAGIIGLLMLVTMLFSAFYIAAEINHDCSGEDCPVCACIQQCENTLRGVGNGTPLPVSVIGISLILLITACCPAVISQDTPVSRKVRLNN